MNDIDLDDIVEEASAWPHARIRARQVAVDTAEQLLEAARAGAAEHPELAELVIERARALLSGV